MRHVGLTGVSRKPLRVLSAKAASGVDGCEPGGIGRSASSCTAREAPSSSAMEARGGDALVASASSSPT
eukprot:3029107-Prorocentrum_lima.AAC.1